MWGDLRWIVQHGTHLCWVQPCAPKGTVYESYIWGPGSNPNDLSLCLLCSFMIFVVFS